MPSKNPNNHASRFKPQDNVAKVRLQPIGAKLPPELDEIVRGIKDRSAFVRRAITNQLIAEGYLSSASVAIATPETPSPATKNRPTYWVRLGSLSISRIALPSQREIIAQQPEMYGRVLSNKIDRITKFEEVRTLEEVQNIPNAKIIK